MKGYLIDPTIKTIAPVEYDGDYKSIYRLIDAQTFDVVGIDQHNGIYIDDEGLLVDNPGPFFTATGRRGSVTIAGKGLVLGHDAEGEMVGASISIEALQAMIAFPDLKFTGFTHEEGETHHPILGKAFVIKNEAHFEPVEPEATNAHDSGQDR